MALLAIDVEPEAVALVVSLAALGLSAASLWSSALRPAELVLTYVQDVSAGISGGGIGTVPTLYRLELIFELSNLGARAGLLRSIEVARVTASGAPEFATGATAWPHGEPLVEEVGVGKIDFPRTIEPSDVRSIRLRFELQGAFHTASNTTPTPPLEPLAKMLPDLDRVKIEIACNYRRRGVLRRRPSNRTVIEPIVIQGSEFRELARMFWGDPQGTNRSDLAELVDGPQ
jgi:hypothetical protein